jgi:hypothetical protein
MQTDQHILPYIPTAREMFINGHSHQTAIGNNGKTERGPR